MILVNAWAFLDHTKRNIDHAHVRVSRRLRFIRNSYHRSIAMTHNAIMRRRRRDDELMSCFIALYDIVNLSLYDYSVLCTMINMETAALQSLSLHIVASSLGDYAALLHTLL